MNFTTKLPELTEMGFLLCPRQSQKNLKKKKKIILKHLKTPIFPAGDQAKCQAQLKGKTKTCRRRRTWP